MASSISVNVLGVKGVFSARFTSLDSCFLVELGLLIPHYLVSSATLFLKINLFYLFIYFWLCWVFVAMHGLSLVVASGGYSSLWCAGFSLQGLLLLRSMGSRRTGFSSCGRWAQ